MSWSAHHGCGWGATWGTHPCDVWRTELQFENSRISANFSWASRVARLSWSNWGHQTKLRREILGTNRICDISVAQNSEMRLAHVYRDFSCSLTKNGNPQKLASMRTADQQSGDLNWLRICCCLASSLKLLWPNEKLTSQHNATDTS